MMAKVSQKSELNTAIDQENGSERSQRKRVKKNFDGHLEVSKSKFYRKRKINEQKQREKQRGMH